MPYERLLHSDNDGDRKHLSFFVNEAGEASIRDFPHLLTQFGSRFIYSQRVGINHTNTINRTIFGFSSLEEALRKSLALQQEVKKEWLFHIMQIARMETQWAGAAISLMQSCVPNMVVIFPSQEDREYVGQAGDWPVWIMPFAVSPVQSALTQGGAVIMPESRTRLNLT